MNEQGADGGEENGSHTHRRGDEQDRRIRELEQRQSATEHAERDQEEHLSALERWAADLERHVEALRRVLERRR